MKTLTIILSACFLSVGVARAEKVSQVEDLKDYWGYGEAEILAEYGRPSKVSTMSYGEMGEAKVYVYKGEECTTEFRLLDGVIFRAQETWTREYRD